MAICSITGCDLVVDARGWCEKHYTRWRRHGDPLFTKTSDRGSPLLERLLRRITVGDCWEWTGGQHSAGYGVLGFKGEHLYAHRAIWELLVGPIPEELTLDHLCRNRKCINPDHLEPVPHRDNVLRGESPNARNARAKTCKRGHVFTPENTYRNPTTGYRTCRACVAYLKVCREGRVPPPAPTSFGDVPSWQSLREGAPSVGPSTRRIAPSRRSLRRVP